MCISPDELTTKQLERNMLRLREWAKNPKVHEEDRAYYVIRADLYEGLLKERAEAGTY
jgi:hypothetical protein